MFILNEEIKEQERQAIRELYPKFPDTQVIVTKVPLKPFYKAHRIQFVAMAHVTKILAKYGYLEVSGDKVALRYRRTKDSISLPDLVKMVDELHMTKFPSMSILSRVPKNEKKTIIEPEEDKPTKVDIPKRIPKQVLDLPIIGNKYFIDLSHTDIIRSIDIIGIKIKNILLYGETGTGKEHIARYIHFIKKTSGNFIPVDCGSLNDELIASEFYGHIKGAFTGAHQDKEGYFEQAHGGTLFLDEIENLSLRGQVTLLRALQELTFMKVGDYRVQKVDFNLVCTTNVKLWDLIDEGKFRSDLYYRIAHMEFTIPPVRDYYNIPGLMEFLIDQICEEYDLHVRIDRKDLVLDTMRKLDPYKGNIREIKSYLTKKLIELESTQRSTLTGIELMKSFKL